MDCTIYTPGIGTHSFTVSSPLGSSFLQLYSQSLQLSICCSSRYLMLGGQRQHGIRSICCSTRYLMLGGQRQHGIRSICCSSRYLMLGGQRQHGIRSICCSSRYLMLGGQRQHGIRSIFCSTRYPLMLAGQSSAWNQKLARHCYTCVI